MRLKYMFLMLPLFQATYLHSSTAGDRTSTKYKLKYMQGLVGKLQEVVMEEEAVPHLPAIAERAPP